MKEGYVIREQEKAHFITATVVDWIDVFTRKIYRDCIIDCLDFCIKNKGMIVYGYVIMSNHIHFIVQSPCWRKRLACAHKGIKKQAQACFFVL